MASFWPYDADCRLIDEHIYEDTGSRRIEKTDPADVITTEKARELLAPCSTAPCPDPIRPRMNEVLTSHRVP
ncbi:hypothetical protein [Streptomyces phaeochromogenes]|uniref:hypothetical protein n=1 Tax=Streptomyces phaeochromogenes TaxID=1923 RepID=UPI0038693229|nr:hypothetical protein OG478_01180 [Streptomyces phaeochromogenes]WSW11708.1 hypothetical protein OG277_00925 [Streptomyces phaeochromogenes]